MYGSIISDSININIDKKKIFTLENEKTFLDIKCPRCKENFRHIFNYTNQNPSMILCIHCYKWLSISIIEK